jgi:hypothetical protein
MIQLELETPLGNALIEDNGYRLKTDTTMWLTKPLLRY